MRKLLMSLTVLAGATVASASIAHAAPDLDRVHVPAAAPSVQQAEYYRGEDWRYREWRRHEAWERQRREHEWRRRHEERRGWW